MHGNNDPISHLIYYISKLVSNCFMVSIFSFKSSSIQHDGHLVNYGPIQSKIDNKAAYDLGQGFGIDRLTMSCGVFFNEFTTRHSRSRLPVSYYVYTMIFISHPNMVTSGSKKCRWSKFIHF